MKYFIILFQETDDLTDDKSLTVEIFPESVRVDELTKLVNSVFGKGQKANGVLRKPGGSNEETPTEDDLEEKLKKAGMPEDVQKIVFSEYKVQSRDGKGVSVCALKNFQVQILDSGRYLCILRY